MHFLVMHFLVVLPCTTACLSRVAAQDAKPAAAPAQKITYDEHVRPILREHCFSCHSADKQESDLALDTYQKAMAGGSSGEVVIAGDLGSSRLWALVSHMEEPKMPPRQDRLAAAKLDLISKWIEQGAPENARSQVTIKKNPLASAVVSSIGRPSGPIAMPTGLVKQPVLHTQRPGQITALAASPWAPLVAVAGQKQVSLYQSDTGELIGILPFPEGIPYVLRFSRNGSLLLAGGGRGGQSGCVVLYDVASGRRIAKIGDELDAVLAADINSTHTLVALGGPNRVVRIYSVQSGEVVHEIRKHTDWIYAAEFSPDGKLLATADRGGGLFVWEAETARESLMLRGHTGAVFDVSWRPDSQMFASSGEDGTIKLWGLSEGPAVKSWNAHAAGAFCVRYAHDGRLVSSGRDNAVKTWTADGAAQKSFPAFAEAALRCAFTHDGQRVVGGDWLGNVKLWNAEKATELGSLVANPPTLEMRIAAAKADLVAKEGLASEAAKELEAALKELDQLSDAKSDAEAKVAAKRQASEAAAAAVEAAKVVLDNAEADKRAFDERAAKLAAAADEAAKKAAAAEAALAEAQAAAAAASAEQKAFADAYAK
jgi:WD40 repeat protein